VILVIAPTFREATVWARSNHLDPKHWRYISEEYQFHGYDRETTRLCVLRMHRLDSRQIHLALAARQRYPKTGLVDG
jgi:hypothetical protein